MEIRQASTEDVPKLREIVEGAYGVYVERIGRRPSPMDDDYDAKVADEQVWVAEDDDGIGGLLVLVRAYDHLLVENVSVDPDRQGAGIGRELVQFAEEQAREAGLGEVRLHAYGAMAENRTFYSRLGYREGARWMEANAHRISLAKRL